MSAQPVSVISDTDRANKTDSVRFMGNFLLNNRHVKFDAGNTVALTDGNRGKPSVHPGKSSRLIPLGAVSRSRVVNHGLGYREE